MRWSRSPASRSSSTSSTRTARRTCATSSSCAASRRTRSTCRAPRTSTTTRTRRTGELASLATREGVARRTRASSRTATSLFKSYVLDELLETEGDFVVAVDSLPARTTPNASRASADWAVCSRAALAEDAPRATSLLKDMATDAEHAGHHRRVDGPPQDCSANGAKTVARDPRHAARERAREAHDARPPPPPRQGGPRPCASSTRAAAGSTSTRSPTSLRRAARSNDRREVLRARRRSSPASRSTRACRART